MHYLVTGGAGFIGSHLCDTLLAAGHAVSVLDNFSTGKRSNLHSGVTIIEADCADEAALAALIPAVDGVFHLAAVASVELSCKQWLATSYSNQFATIAVLEAIARTGKPLPFVYASSAATYGDPDPSQLPLCESTPTVPLTPYGADKLGSELHARVARHVFGIPTLGLRFFNVYGSRQDPASPYSGVISIFMNRLRHHQPITIHGDGGQTRDFIHVSDVVAHLTAAMALLESGRLPDVAALNVCTQMSVSIAALAQHIAEACGVTPDISFGPARSGDVRLSCGSRELAMRWLGVEPKTSLAEGLRETLRSMPHGAAA